MSEPSPSTNAPSGSVTSGPTVVILDYGSGNLRSAERAFQRAGADVEVTGDTRKALAADGLVVPGVGAYEACMRGLLNIGGDRIIDDRLSGGRPVLGICVGMQILFEEGVEFGVKTRGCGQWPGVVERLDAPILPHMGWNTIAPPPESVLFAGVAADTRFYFVHSYAAQRWELEVAPSLPPARVTWSHHSVPFIAAVESGPLMATQFHPEKSGDAGARVIRNWVDAL